MKTIALSLLLFLTLANLCTASIKLPSIFSNNMVLQCDQEIPIWGSSLPSDDITISLKDQKIRTKADSEGKWMAKLKPMQASFTPLILTISNNTKSLKIKNVLIGEVWLCAGQSNMQWTLKWSSLKPKNPKYAPIVEAIDEERKSGRDPHLRQINVPARASMKNLLTDFEGVWVESSPKNNGDFTAAGYYFAKELRRELNVPVGLIKCAWGGTRIQPWIPKSAYMQNEHFANYYNEAIKHALNKQSEWDPKVLIEHKKKIEAEKDPRKKQKLKNNPPIEPIKNKQLPSTIFNGMLHPIIPYAIRGAIWYQGENNANDKYKMDEYKDYFTTLIHSWREHWNQGDFPFYFAQLANSSQPYDRPLEKSTWATISNQQRLSLEVKNTGMIVLNDVGEAEDIHPRNKIDVGKRFSLWALNKDYHRNDIVYSGPLYKSSEFIGQKVIIKFSSVGGGLMVGKKHLHYETEEVQEPLKGFQICGIDRQWKWADAEISSKDTVTVSHPEVTEPIEVRYAWAWNPPAANLYNKEGLPTSVFKANKN